jgi:hypothetical protein
MKNLRNEADITRVIGEIPYRMALAGGWIDQPFLSRHNPSPPGSMVVVCLEPLFLFMDRAGMGTSTRNTAIHLWNGKIPGRKPDQLVRELYAAENQGKPEPSGSQDMAGLLYPAINRLDYDAGIEGGYFPCHVESEDRLEVVSWLEQVIQILPVGQRPVGYNPLGIMRLEAEWIRRLSQSGKDCFDAILSQDLKGLGASMNECMLCWETLLPYTVRHSALKVDLSGILEAYQSRYSGAMYSGCGGGYLYVASDEPVPGAFHIKVRTRLLTENSE